MIVEYMRAEGSIVASLHLDFAKIFTMLELSNTVTNDSQTLTKPSFTRRLSLPKKRWADSWGSIDDLMRFWQVDESGLLYEYIT